MRVYHKNDSKGMIVLLFVERNNPSLLFDECSSMTQTGSLMMRILYMSD